MKNNSIFIFKNLLSYSSLEFDYLLLQSGFKLNKYEILKDSFTLRV
jgi:hypothetical protein